MEVLGWSREALYRSPEVELQDPQIARFEGFVGRRGRGEPVAFLTGSREFWSMEFRVTRDVLIPRPETEHLVETVLDFLASHRGRCRILEIGTGSGAIAVSLAKECPPGGSLGHRRFGAGPGGGPRERTPARRRTTHPLAPG